MNVDSLVRHTIWLMFQLINELEQSTIAQTVVVGGKQEDSHKFLDDNIIIARSIIWSLFSYLNIVSGAESVWG